MHIILDSTVQEAAESTSVERFETEVRLRLQELKDLRNLLDSGVAVEGLDDDIRCDFCALDMEHVAVDLGVTKDGHLTLHLT